MKLIWHYLRPYAWKMSGGMGIKFFGAIMDLLIPALLAHIIDDIIPLKVTSAILIWGGVMILCSLLSLAANVISNMIASWVSKETVKNIRHDLFHKISYLSCSQIDGFSIPSLISRLTGDTYNLHNMISMIQRMGIRAPILLLGGIIVTMSLEPVLSLLLIAMMPPLAFLILFISRKGIPLYTKLQRSIDRMVQIIRENIIGSRVIKALSKADYENSRFDEVNQTVVQNEKKAALTMAISNPCMTFFLNLGLTLVVLVGAFRVNNGVSQTGEIIAFLSYFTIILNALMAISRIFVMSTKGIASSNRIRDVLYARQTLKTIPGEEEAHEDFHISFEHVNFSYNDTDETLHDINFSVKKGETLGIIGSTGSGKTTVINLMMRLYDARKGMIRIGGRDIRTIPPEELHTKFGVVFQHDVLFADTIAENISFGRDIPMEQIEKAAKDAQAIEFIGELPDHFQHELTIKGSNLSGGQKQRLLIARALAGNPEILILDDSSSALDYKTDASLRTAIHSHYANTTTVIIAQRVSSILHADHILVLDEGKEIGYGTHDELMQSCEAYREISELQMGGGNNAQV